MDRSCTTIFTSSLNQLEGGCLARLRRWRGAPYVSSGELTLVMDSDGGLSVDIQTMWPQTKFLSQRTYLLIDAQAAQVPIFMG